MVESMKQLSDKRVFHVGNLTYYIAQDVFTVMPKLQVTNSLS